MKKLFGLLLASVFVLTVSTSIRAQESTTATKTAKQARWEGTVVRINTDNTMDVRQVGGNLEKKIHFNSETAWNSQYHGSTTVNKIEPSDVKEGDRVICLGAYNDKTEFYATTISKRLSHNPKSPN